MFEKTEICKVCLREDGFLVDFGKCCKMRIWTRKSALMQLRTSPGKSEGAVAQLSSQPLVLREEADAAEPPRGARRRARRRAAPPAGRTVAAGHLHQHA